MIRIGISGWNYPAWRGGFYPDGLAHRRELGYAGERFTSIELNGTFYSLQRPTSFSRWRDEVPDGFVFAVKGGRYLTHMLRLRNIEAAMSNFFASGVLALQPKLGPFLWQLPPQLDYEPDRIADFFARLPRTAGAAAKLAAAHDDKLAEDRVVLTAAKPRQRLRHAVEVRDESFRSDQFYAQCRDHDIAVVLADTAGRWPELNEATADFGYVRLHGHTELYASGYSAASLDRWAELLLGWEADGRDSYVYFDNDARGHAPFDALSLIERVQQ